MDQQAGPARAHRREHRAVDALEAEHERRSERVVDGDRADVERIPAEPVPLIGRVNAFSVRNTVRSRSMVSSSTWMNSGSMCPSIGRESAATASGYGFDGPGPSSNRSEMGIRGCYLPLHFCFGAPTSSL